MALNKFMHPRNIYKSPPDFAKLARNFPEFSNISKVDLAGNVTIDFKDPESLRILTKCLLKSDFDLDVVIPEERLVPTLPLRLNYVLWLEDIMKAIEKDQNVRGLDIGTGACAIYPLLASVKNKWHMVGTETDQESLCRAQDNVQRNNLQELIELKKNDTSSIIEHLFPDNNDLSFHFSMCNPPFYSNMQELCESRSPARPPPKNGFTGSPHELITEGGELEFCRKMIAESKNCKDKVIIFTTMVGHKFNLEELIEDLKAESLRYTHTEFCQGRVTRWGLAWTHQDYDIYKLFPPRGKLRKKNTSTVYQLPELKNSDNNIVTIQNKFKTILQDLHITYKILNKRGNCMSLDIQATENTWSNQRRKRRLMKMQQLDECKKIKLGGGDAKELTNNNLKDKPEMYNDSAESNTDTHDLENCYTTVEDSPSKTQKELLVHAFIKMFRKDDHIFLETDFLNGTSGKEGLHQIVQYIKNNWK